MHITRLASACSKWSSRLLNRTSTHTGHLSTLCQGTGILSSRVLFQDRRTFSVARRCTTPSAAISANHCRCQKRRVCRDTFWFWCSAQIRQCLNLPIICPCAVPSSPTFSSIKSLYHSSLGRWCTRWESGSIGHCGQCKSSVNYSAWWLPRQSQVLWLSRDPHYTRFWDSSIFQ